MPSEIAKLLDRAGTFLDRTEAVKFAMAVGLPIAEIEEYLDWLDQVRQGSRKESPASTFA